MKCSLLLSMLVIGMLLFNACGTSTVTEQAEQTTTTSTTTTTTPEATTLTSEQINLAIQVIKGYPEVRDAAVSRDGKDLSLVLIVDYATSKTQAKNLGDNFVRLVKTYGPEPSPGKEIGAGTFDYLIGVYYPNQEMVAMGAKVSFSDHITW